MLLAPGHPSASSDIYLSVYSIVNNPTAVRSVAMALIQSLRPRAGTVRPPVSLARPLHLISGDLMD
jgi:hypothetical protein